MPNNQTSINIGVKYNVEQASLNSLKKSLQDLQKIDIGNFNGSERQLEKLKNEIRQVENAFKRAFNQDLGTLKVLDFNKSLLKIYGSSENVYKSFAKFGAKGQATFSQMASSVLTTNLQLRLTHSLINQMGLTMANTVKWGVASSVMNNFTNSVQQAFQYVKGLDSALTDIRIVTGQSAQEMQSFAAQANNAAQSLGRSTMDYTKAALTFYQQGLSDVDVQARTEAVLKAQNITGAGDEMADYLTAVWNGYKVANEEAELYVDKLAAVADSSASNMSLLAIAMSKVASSANLLGVPVDSLNAQIATIVATTRQAPESVGNALKTIYSRINDIVTGADDAEISLGNYSAKMALVGISVLDANGRLRDTGDVIDEIGGKWETLSHEQQIYLARTMAGQRQYNNLLALFENWGKYSDLVNISMDSQGTLVEKNSRYMESLAAKMEQLGAAGERVKSALIDENDLKGIVLAGTSAVNVFANLIESIGGGKGALLNFGSVFAQVFSGTISKEISNAMVAAQNKAFNQLKIQGAKDRYDLYSLYFNSGIAKDYVDDLKSFYEYEKVLSDEDKKIQLGLILRRRELREEQTVLEEGKKIAEKYYNSISGKDLKEASDTKIGVALRVANEDLELLQLNYQKFSSSFNEISLGKVNKELKAGYSLLGYNRQLEDGSWLYVQSNYQKLQENKKIAEEYANSIRETFKDRELVDVLNLPIIKVLNKIIKTGTITKTTLENLSDAEKDLIGKEKIAIEELKDSGRTQNLLDRNRKQQEDVNNEFLPKKSAALIQKQTQDVVKFTAGLSQMFAVMNNIKNLGSIWQNKDISAGEKILQTITNLGMSAPMAVTGFLSMKDALPGVIGTVLTLATRLSSTGVAAATTAGQLGQIAMAVGPYVAIFAGVAAAIYLIYKEWNKENEAAKKAALIAQKARKDYEDLKSTYEELKSSLENYNSAQEAIQNMTKGTQEWRDAIRESNDAVLDLIQSYPELASAVLNVNGQLIISEQGQQQALLNTSTTVDNARLASIAATAESRDASLRLDARNASRFAGLISYSGDFIQATTDQVMKVVEAYSTATDRSVLALAEETGMSEQLVSSILTEVDNMDLLVALLQANTEATKLSYEAMASEKLQGNSIYEGLDDLGKQVADAIAGQDLMAETDIDKFLTTDDSFKQLSKFSDASDSYMIDILDRFREAMGDASIDWASNAAQGFGGKLLHFMIDGKEALYTKEQVAATIAASEALQSLTGSVEKARDVLNDIGKISNQSNSTALKDFIGNEGFGNLTSGQLNELNPYSHLMKVFFDEHAKELGYSGGKLFQNAFVEAQQAALKDWDLLGADSLQPVQDTINKFFKEKDFSLLTAQNIKTALDLAFKQIGSEGLESLTNLFDDSTLNIDLIIKTISSADISTPEGLQKLTEELQKIGDGSFAASEGWLNFVNQVSQTQFENPLDSIFERQLSVNKITKGLNKYSVISDEDYNTLLQINPQIDSLFSRVAEGYLFIGQKGSLMELLTGGTNGYILAANLFDKIKGSALDVSKYFSDTFGELFSSSAFQRVDLTSAVSKVFDQIDSQLSSLKLWSALGFNEDYLQAEMDKYLLLLVKSNRTKLSESLQSEFTRLEQELQSFLNTAANATGTLEGVTDALREAAALNALSFSELNSLFANGEITAESYANSIQKVSQALAENYGLDLEDYLDYVTLLRATNELLANNEALARQVAIENMRVSKGIDDLVDNWENYNDIISDYLALDRDINTIALSWGLLSETLANLLNVDESTIDLLGPDFVADHWDKIQLVKDGVENAYLELLQLSQERIIEIAIEAAGTDQAKTLIQNAYDLISNLSQNIPDFTIMANTLGLDLAKADLQSLADAAYDAEGASQESANAMLAAFQQIAESAHWGSAQAQAAYKALGYDIEVVLKPGQLHKTPTSTDYYVPPVYTTLKAGLVSLGFGGTSFPLIVPKLVRGGHFQSVPGTGGDFEPGTYSIKSITKNGSSGGNISRKQVAAPSRSSTPSRGGGGGSKGSAPKAATQAKVSTAKIETTEKTPDHNPYEQELKSFLRQSKILDDLQDKLKKLVNKDRLKNLQEQNKTLEKQKDILEKELAISANSAAENSTADYARKLKDSFGDALKFDTDGQISDINNLERNAAEAYNEAAKAATDAFNKLKEAYNNYILNTWNAYGTQENQELHKAEKEFWDQHIKEAEEVSKKAIKDAEEEYKTREDLIKSYNKAWEEDQKRLENIKLIQDKIYENLIAISKIKVDLSIDTGDFEREWLDFENKFIKKLDKNDFLGSAKASAKELMSYFNSKQVQLTANQIKKIRDEIAIMNAGGTSSIYGNNLAQAKEDLEEYMKQQMDDLEEIQDMVDNIKDNYLDAIDSAKDKMDLQIDQYERVNDLIDHNVKMVELLYGDKAYDSMLKYYNLQKTNNERELESLKKQQDYWQKRMEGEVVGSDAWERFKKNLDDVTDNLNSKLEDMIDNLASQFENRVNGIIDRLNNALTGGRGLDFLDEQWDYISNYDDNFLDTFETKTGIDEVERLYQSLIDNLAGSPKSQQALNKLMNDQLKLLREKDHLTEYDLERAKASLEVEKARLALEEARDRKTKMRLRRDSQGNYTYQYVADEEKLGDLQAALADAQANLYNTDKLHYKQNLNTLYDTYKLYIEKMRDLTAEYNATQDEEERKRIQGRIDLLKESTAKLMSGLTEDNKYLLNYLNGSFFDGMGVDTSALTMEEQMEIMKENIPYMQSLIQDLSDTIVGEGGILPATANMMELINKATADYDLNVKNMLTAAGTSLQTIEEAVDKEGNALDKNIINAEKLITTNDELIKSCQAQIEAMEKLLDYMDKYLNKVMNVLTLLSNLRSAYNTGQGLNGSNLTADNIGMETWGLDTTSGMLYTGNPKTDAAAIKQQIDALMAQYLKFLSAMTIATFDTGGYTGTWGDAEGRLAFLHSGELVLNQDDTMNILNAVQIVRSMASAINSIASGEINSLMNGASGLLGGINNTEQLDQNVHIEANFPNVTQHTLIEQAFENLVNMASMRASRYRD